MAIVGAKGLFGQTFNENTWSSSGVATVDLYSVSCVTMQSGWVAGGSGLVAHTIDGGWSFATQRTPFTTSLRAITFVSQTFGVVAGDSGALALTLDGGTTWVGQPVGTGATLRGTAIAGAAGTILAVGDQATLVVSRDGGGTWHTGTIAGAGNLHSVATDTAAQLVLAVDDGGNVWSSTDGARTFSHAATAAGALDSVTLVGGNTAVAAGAGGTALARFAGGAWRPMSTGTTVNLHAGIVRTDDGHVYVAGDEGTLLESSDQGAHWSAVSVATTSAIYALDELL